MPPVYREKKNREGKRSMVERGKCEVTRAGTVVGALGYISGIIYLYFKLQDQQYWKCELQMATIEIKKCAC